MPSTIPIAEFVLGAIFTMLAITGGKFEIFGAKVAEISSSILLRTVLALLGIFMFTLALYGNPLNLLAKPYITRLENVDYHNDGGSSDLWSGFLDDEEDCSSKCLNDKNCLGFTYSHSQGKCFLKEKLGKQIPNRDTDSGKKQYH